MITICVFIEIKFDFLAIDFIEVTGNFKLNTRYLNLSSSSCEPIFKINKQHYANLSGEIYPKIIRYSHNKSINFECLNKNNKPKLILLWNPFGGHYLYPNGNGGFIDNDCPVTNCQITNDKRRINESDFVVIHIVDKFIPLPSSRPKNQRIIFMAYESPAHSSIDKKHSELFNLTTTYAYNSDFPSGQTNMLWEKNPTYNPKKNYLLGKTELAMAIISNCGSKSNRLDYINEMKKFISIDVYGRCGKPCGHKECKKVLSEKYMFYLSFENSLCENYITEKFWETLKFDLIPVVRGKGKYETYIPKSGYIDVRDYDTIEKLTDYLKYLSKNNTAYNSYFKWKEHVIFPKTSYSEAPSMRVICDMCVYLNLEYYFGIKKSIVKNASNYWSSSLNCAKKV